MDPHDYCSPVEGAKDSMQHHDEFTQALSLGWQVRAIQAIDVIMSIAAARVRMV